MGGDGNGGKRNSCFDDDSGGQETRAQSPTPPQPQPPSPSKDKPSNGCIYTALWPFDARHQDELSFKEGDLFSVVSRTGDWWRARKIDKNGRVLDTGIVPNNYLERAESLKMQL